jgi:hypothetical protein
LAENPRKVKILEERLKLLDAVIDNLEERLRLKDGVIHNMRELEALQKAVIPGDFREQ